MFSSDLVMWREFAPNAWSMATVILENHAIAYRVGLR